MSNIYPDQLRTIDPYSQYNSNIVNRLSRIITTGRNCLRNLSALTVTRSGDAEIEISIGMCFKDDVVIEIENPFTVDLTDASFYVEGGNAFDENGYYFVLLKYTYQKAFPAPRAAVSILKPSQLSSYYDDATAALFLFLGCLDVETNPAPPPGHRIKLSNGVLSYYPTDPTILRQYAPFFVGVYETLPSWNSSYEGELVYIISEGRLYFASETQWIKLAKKYTYAQAVPADTWTIIHGLDDQYLTVNVFDSSWHKIDPSDVESTDVNTCTITFPIPVSGFATIAA